VKGLIIREEEVSVFLAGLVVSAEIDSAEDFPVD
jgi:hypothetical protein